MSLYLNCKFDDERLALEIATNKGWSDFGQWAAQLPDEFALVRALGVKGEAAGSRELEQQLKAALQANAPGESARQVAERLAEVVPYKGTLVVSEEPDDSEFDEEENDEDDDT